MKTLMLIFFALVSLFFIESEAKTRFGVFLIVKGTVKIKSPSGADKNVTIGLDVSPGDILTTGPESIAKIITMDRNVIVVGEKSKIVFEKYHFENEKQKAVVIDVKEGNLRSSIRNKYDEKRRILSYKNTDFYCRRARY